MDLSKLLLERYVRLLLSEVFGENEEKRKLAFELNKKIFSYITSNDPVSMKSSFSKKYIADDIEGIVWNVSEPTTSMGLPPLQFVIVPWEPEHSSDGMILFSNQTNNGVAAIVIYPVFGSFGKLKFYGQKQKMRTGLKNLDLFSVDDEEQYVVQNVGRVLSSMSSIIRHELIHFIDDATFHDTQKFVSGYRSAAKGAEKYWRHGREREAMIQQAILDAEEEILSGADRQKILGNSVEQFYDWVKSWMHKRYSETFRPHEEKKVLRALAKARPYLLTLKSPTRTKTKRN